MITSHTAIIAQIGEKGKTADVKTKGWGIHSECVVGGDVHIDPSYKPRKLCYGTRRGDLRVARKHTLHDRKRKLRVQVARLAAFCFRKKSKWRDSFAFSFPLGK